jgi:nucleoside-diphosphate-sugar epimerase
MQVPGMRVLILGCGFTGRALARRLADAGAEVTGTVRGPEGVPAVRAAGAAPAVLDLGKALADAPGRRELRALLAGRDGIVFTAGPLRRGEGFVDFLPPFLDALKASGAPPAAFVYVSSTGVYGDRGGDWVDEATPVGDDLGPRGALRVVAERALMDAWRGWRLPVRILRPAGIYGPGRHVGLRLKAGTYRAIEPDAPADPPLTVNRIHVADLARAAEAALTGGAPGEVYVAADDRPASLREVADYAAGLMGLEPPPSEPLAAARARLGDDIHLVADRKRCRNAKLKHDLGVRLAFPTYVEGIRACLEADGLLAPGG